MESLKFTCVFLLISPVLIGMMMFLNPSVAESTIPALGECDITYHGKFYPCLTPQELLRSMIILVIVTAVVLFIISLFLPLDDNKDKQKCF